VKCLFTRIEQSQNLPDEMNQRVQTKLSHKENQLKTIESLIQQITNQQLSLQFKQIAFKENISTFTAKSYTNVTSLATDISETNTKNNSNSHEVYAKVPNPDNNLTDYISFPRYLNFEVENQLGKLFHKTVNAAH
jgi:hypothetical protein